MDLSRICAEQRKSEPMLKTQLRFGRKDIEIYTKLKGEDKGYRKVTLTDFTDMSKIAKFNAKIKWKRYQDKPPRRTQKTWKDFGQRPSTLGQIQQQGTIYKNAGKEMEVDYDTPAGGKNPLTRANSNTTTSAAKKHKQQRQRSSDEEEILSGSEEHQIRTTTTTNVL